MPDEHGAKPDASGDSDAEEHARRENAARVEALKARARHDLSAAQLELESIRRAQQRFFAEQQEAIHSRAEQDAERLLMLRKSYYDDSKDKFNRYFLRDSAADAYLSMGWSDIATGMLPSAVKRLDDVIGEWKSKLIEREKQLELTSKALEEAKKQAGQSAAQAEELKRLSERLQNEIEEKGRHIDLSHLLTRVNVMAAKRLLEDESFRAEFLKSPCTAYVLSIDVRRSTELMLKARDPAGFAQFLIELAAGLKTRILANHGVFEKFTGDGVLAYFPEHFSGKDAGYRALTAASECHAVFTGLYRANRHRFNSVIKNTGLGIGIDHGIVHTMVVSGEFAVVGTPVVYACRMAGADAGETLLNQGAYESIVALYEPFCVIEEAEIEIKHEGPTVAYRVVLNQKPFKAHAPLWDGEAQTDSAAELQPSAAQRPSSGSGPSQ